MRMTTDYQLTPEQLACFLKANGLVMSSVNYLLTPRGETVGMVLPTGQTFLVIVFEEGYIRKDEEETVTVTAWWPSFRPSWVETDLSGSTISVGPPLGPDEVICDVCNAVITIRPVPLVGSYALCPRCFEKTGLPFPGRIQPYEPEPADDPGKGGQR